ncbi:MAG: NosD domain-containing protein [archaeon]
MLKKREVEVALAIVVIGISLLVFNSSLYVLSDMYGIGTDTVVQDLSRFLEAFGIGQEGVMMAPGDIGVGLLDFGPCVNPFDGLNITESTLLCSGTFVLNDSDDQGVIRILWDNVHLKCDGTRIIGLDYPYPRNSIGIRLGNFSQTGLVKNATIEGCYVENYYYGVDLWRSENAKIINNTVVKNEYGIIATENNASLFENNTVLDTIFVGIMVSGGTVRNKHNIINNNYLRNCTFCIDTFPAAGYNLTISNNFIENITTNKPSETRPATGISDFDVGVGASNRSRIFNNTILNGGLMSRGMWLNQNESLISGNYISYTNTGMYVGSDSRNNLITENTFHGNDYGLQLASPSEGNNITNNTICNNGIGDIFTAFTILARGDDNYCDTTIQWSDNGDHTLNLGCEFACSQASSCETPYDGMNITTDTTLCSGDYYLNDSDYDGLIRVLSSGITVSCQGTRIHAPAPYIGAQVGISIGRNFRNPSDPIVNNVVINNCYFSDFEKAIITENSNDHQFINNEFESDFQSIFIEDTAGLFIFNNTMSGTMYGVWSRNSINDSVIQGNLMDYGSGSFSGGTGISLDTCSACKNNTIRDNTILNRGGDGIYFFSSWFNQLNNDNKIINNTISNVDAGILFYRGNNSLIEGNSISSSAGDCTDFNLWNSVVANNTISGCTNNGLYIGGNYSNYLNNNITNALRGIYIFGGNNNNISYSRSCGNLESDVGVTVTSTGNFGDENVCDSTINWNDQGSSGCSSSCSGPPPEPCVVPYDNLYITNDTTLCSGTYNLYDANFNGLIVTMNNHTNLKCDGTKIINADPAVGYAIGLGDSRGNLDFPEAYNVSVEGCTFENFNVGITTYRSEDIRIINNTFINLSYGVSTTTNKGFEVRDNTFIDNSNSLYFVFFEDAIVDGNNITAINDWAFTGIETYANITNVTFSNNFIDTENYGILFWSSSFITRNNRVINNVFVGDGTGFAIHNFNFDNNTLIQNNTVTGYSACLGIHRNLNIDVLDNKFNCVYYGMSISSTNNSNFLRNNISGNWYGVMMTDSFNNNLGFSRFCESSEYDILTSNSDSSFGDENYCDISFNWSDSGPLINNLSCKYYCDGSLRGVGGWQCLLTDAYWEG